MYVPEKTQTIYSSISVLEMEANIKIPMGTSFFSGNLVADENVFLEERKIKQFHSSGADQPRIPK